MLEVDGSQEVQCFQLLTICNRFLNSSIDGLPFTAEAAKAHEFFDGDDVDVEISGHALEVGSPGKSHK